MNKKIFVLMFVSVLSLIGCSSGGSKSEVVASYRGSTEYADLSGNGDVPAASAFVHATSLTAIAGMVADYTNSAFLNHDQTEYVRSGNQVSQIFPEAGEYSKIATISFNGYKAENFATLLQDVYIRGRIKISIARNVDVVPGRIAHSSIQGEAQFSGLEISGLYIDHTFDGTIQFSGPNAAHWVVDLVATHTRSGDQTKISNLTIDFGQLHSDGSIALAEYEGSIFRSNLGRIDVKTNASLEPISYSRLSNMWASKDRGEIEISTPNGELYFRPLSDMYASILRKENSILKALRVSWYELSEGKPIMTHHMAQPRANPGDGGVVFLGEKVLVHGLFSHDDGREYLAFNWSLVFQPPGGGVNHKTINSPFFEFEPQVPGDYIFRLVVSDGMNFSEASVLINVEPNSQNLLRTFVMDGQL